MRRQDAVSLLSRNSARTISGCYTNPNARCPVCGASVFFYANAFGSRVYFDDLGHPWPKHPCTDNPRRKFAFEAVTESRPIRRPRGLANELVAAAQTAGMFTPTADARGWRLLVVLSAERSGDMNVVTAEFLDGASELIKFRYLSPASLLEAGDFASKKGDAFSFLNRATLTAVTTKDGAVIEATPSNPIEVKSRAAPRQPVTRRLISSKPKPASPPVKRPASHYDMKQAEVVHFHSKTFNIADMCDKFGPIVKSYARSGTRKPSDVAVRLNGEGYRTAAGARWTPRLSFFLLGLIFTEPTSRKAAKDPPSKPGLAPSLQSEQRQREPRPLTQEDLVSRLSALGRVVVKGK